MEFTDEMVDDDTVVLNDGEYVGYAKASFGPFTVEFERGRKSRTFGYTEAQFVVEGPIIDQKVYGASDVSDSDVINTIESWDYIERVEDEVYRAEKWL